MIPFLMMTAAATADAGQPVCVRQEPVAGFERWGHSTGATLAVGREATLDLKPATQVDFKPALARPTKKGTYGGFFPLAVAKAGRYGIALSAGAWLDVISKGDRLPSVDHAQGPACSGIAKVLTFDLQPGRYWLQLSEAQQPAIDAMVTAAK